MFATVIQCVTRFGSHALLLGRKYLPEILVGSGIAGFVGSVVCACKSTTKAEQILNEQDEMMARHARMAEDDGIEYTTDDQANDDKIIRNRTKWKLVKAWAPTVTLMALSAVLILAGVHILHVRSAAMATAYKALEKGFNTYRERVREKYGSDADRELIAGEETTCEKLVKESENAVSEVKGGRKDSGSIASPYAIWFDRDTSSSWTPNPEANWTFLRNQERILNHELRIKGYVFLNEVYEALDMKFGPNNVPYQTMGQLVGWVLSKDGSTDGYIDFGLDDPDNKSAKALRQCKSSKVLLDFNVDGPIYNLL